MKFQRTTNVLIDSSLLFVFLLFSINCFSQTRSSLEEQRSQIIKQIELTSDVLLDTKKNKEKTQQQYEIIQNQISERKTLLRNIDQSIQLLDQDLDDNKNTIDSLENNLEKLNSQYALLLQMQLRKKIIENPWLTILSSSSFSEAFTKWRLFKQYENYFIQQSLILKTLKGELQEYTDLIQQDIDKKQELLVSEKTQAERLKAIQKDKDKILKSLTADERKLQSRLDAKRKERENLNQAIENAILKELKLLEKKETVEPIKTVEISNTVSFESMKGQLARPVDGKIISWFGKHDHPTIKNIQIENNGIDIKSQAGATVRSVHDGIVLSISFIPGHQNMIMVKHDSYFAVYSKIKSVSVEIGQAIKKNDPIGVLNTDSENNTILHFEIWKGKLKENPSQWLKR